MIFRNEIVGYFGPRKEKVASEPASCTSSLELGVGDKKEKIVDAAIFLLKLTVPVPADEYLFMTIGPLD